MSFCWWCNTQSAGTAHSHNTRHYRGTSSPQNPCYIIAHTHTLGTGTSWGDTIQISKIKLVFILEGDLCCYFPKHTHICRQRLACNRRVSESQQLWAYCFGVTWLKHSLRCLGWHSLRHGIRDIFIDILVYECVCVAINIFITHASNHWGVN